MLNYMKSEWYRITHTKDIYVITAVLAAFTLVLNLALFFMGRSAADFPYNTVRFALSNLTSIPNTVLMVGVVPTAVLYTGEKRYGILKNAIACGISRESVFVGKCLVSIAACLCCLLTVLAVYIGSAWLLLEGPAGPAVRELLTAILAVLLSSASSVILILLLYQTYDKDIIAVVGWFLVMVLIPLGFSLIGLRVEVFARIARWMPWNYLGQEVKVTMSTYQCLWDTPSGMMRCVVSGLAGIIVFGGAGLLVSRRKEA